MVIVEHLPLSSALRQCEGRAKDVMAGIFRIVNQGLTTLVGYPFPEGVRALDCSNNQLTSLEGCPPTVTSLCCSDNLLTSLATCPPTVRQLYCGNNLLTSLQGCPPLVTDLSCYGNRLQSLQGCPPTVIDLDCSRNRLVSLLHCPSRVEHLDCSHNLLTSLAGCPTAVRMLTCHGNQLPTHIDVPLSVQTLRYADMLPVRGEQLEAIHHRTFTRRLEVVKEKLAARTIQRAWWKYSLTPNKIGFIPLINRHYDRYC